MTPAAAVADAPRIRVLVVDDSPTVRAVLRRLLRDAPDLEIVAEAEDGEVAIREAFRHHPDVILMDIAMPRMDGFQATKRIMERAPTAILVLSSEAKVNGGPIFEVMRDCGAREVLAKPESPAAWTRLAAELPDLVRGVAQGFVDRRAAPAPTRAAVAATPDLSEIMARSLAELQTIRFLAIGASTGGPEALHGLLSGLRPRPPMAVLVVQHIAQEFEQGLVEWLRGDLGIDIAVARDGEYPLPGTVRLAPQGAHLQLGMGGRLRLDRETPPVRGHRPAADILLASCAQIAGAKAAGVLLSGMGRDGVEGLKAINEAGGLTLVQDRASSVVFGMPQAALEARAARLALAPPLLAKFLLDTCGAAQKP